MKYICLVLSMISFFGCQCAVYVGDSEKGGTELPLAGEEVVDASERSPETKTPTKSCRESADCPGGSCIKLPTGESICITSCDFGKAENCSTNDICHIPGDTAGFCVAPCQTTNDCHPGLVCMQVASGQKSACWLR